MYLCISHNISVSKFWGGGCREVFFGVRLCWENWFHSHCSRLVVMVAMCFPLWSYMGNVHMWVKMVECMLFRIDDFITYQNHKKSFRN